MKNPYSLSLGILALAMPGTAQQQDPLDARVDPVAGERSGGVDLGGDEYASIYAASGNAGGANYDDVYTMPWYQRVKLSGYAAAGTFDTGSVGTRPDGGFLIYESTLFVEARAWENMSVFAEIFLTRWSYDYDEDLHTGELYARLEGLGANEGWNGISLKVGRFDIPFGEEYIWDDATDNPLITSTVAWPYGFDEGVLASGSVRAVNWVAAIMDGTKGRSKNDDAAQSVAGKLYGNARDDLYLSASVMRNGSARESGIQFGKFPIQPVGAGYPSTAGASSSEKVEAFLWELDAVYEPNEHVELSVNYGQNSISDDDGEFDRDFGWLMVQPRVRLSEDVYAVVRYSEIGTFEDDEGYIFDGKFGAKGRTLGYDTKLLQRLSAGIGWELNPNALLKVEVGQDWFDLIDGSPFREENSKRTFYGFQLVLSF